MDGKLDDVLSLLKETKVSGNSRGNFKDPQVSGAEGLNTDNSNSAPVCQICNKIGHSALSCFQLQRENGNNGNQFQKRNNFNGNG